MSQTSTLTISDLLTNDQYIIPIYQRNYAWGDTEIDLLLTDLDNAMQRDPNKNYYIGSLVVAKRFDNKLEVIDGQQRLTTFTLLANYLKQKYPILSLPIQPNVSFEFRQDSDTALKQLFDNTNLENNDLPANFIQAKQSIEKHWGNKQEDLAKFILEKVEIIRTQVPPQTDLNHYFEIMNTRGEQLEKHEVLKARLMGKLAGIEQITFAKLWNACSDMSRYVVMGFEKKLRDHIFGENWDNLPKDFDKLTQFIHENSSQNSQSAKVTTENGEEIQPTLRNILEGKFKGSIEKDNDTSERFNSVIDFPNFLMHVLRIYLEKTLEKTMVTKERISQVPLDEKKLLENFNFLLEEQQQENIKNFALVLLQCRFLFDKFVIKSDTSKEQDDHWSLLTIKPANKSSYQYNNTFAESDNTHAMMLLSMFHVSHPARIYKNWLYAVLRWLFTHRAETVSALSYIKFLENLSDGYYFGYYARTDRKSEDFFNLIFDNDFGLSSLQTEINQETLNNLLHIGTSVPNFIFNRLDYLLWKQDKVQKFRFTFRSSVEHFYPQHPRNPPEGYQTIAEIDRFGNLCLISQSTNSRFSNDMPTAKKANYGGKGHGSLKLERMMAMAEEFEKQPSEAIKKHGKIMIDTLNQKTNT